MRRDFGLLCNNQATFRRAWEGRGHGSEFRLFGRRKNRNSAAPFSYFLSDRDGRILVFFFPISASLLGRWVIPARGFPTLLSPPPPPLLLCLPLSGQWHPPQTEHSGGPLGDPSARVFEVFLIRNSQLVSF